MPCGYVGARRNSLAEAGAGGGFVGGNGGAVTVYGGVVEAKGGDNAAGIGGTTIKAYDGDDYYVTLTFLDEDTVTVKAGKRVKANIGTVLDGTYKRHYGK